MSIFTGLNVRRGLSGLGLLFGKQNSMLLFSVIVSSFIQQLQTSSKNGTLFVSVHYDYGRRHYFAALDMGVKTVIIK